MRILLLIGPPCSGKGTQGEILGKILNFNHISTGSIIRKEKELNTEYGEKVRRYEENGQLVPNRLIQELLINIVKDNFNKVGIILDGFPRTKNQVDFFLKYLKEVNKSIDKMIILKVSEEELIARRKKRRDEHNREDDNLKTQELRFKIYQESTVPAIEYLKTFIPYIEIIAEGTINCITNVILKQIKQ